MTSEVVLLNKDAIVIAADSAVTVGREPHPRYSKSANKIFDASAHGNLAMAIFSGAEIDGVPWELAIKQFRAADTALPQRPTVREYIPAAIQFLQGNALMFPAQWLEERLKAKLAVAALQVVDDVKKLCPDIEDVARPQEEAYQHWAAAVGVSRQQLAGLDLAGGLSLANYQAVRDRIAALAPAVYEYLPQGMHRLVTPEALCDLAIEYSFRAPHYVFSSTGVIFAGYGAAQIFPAFHSITVYGHIGSEICYTSGDEHVIDHSTGAWIQPFAKVSMIQRFTKSRDPSLLGSFEASTGTELAFYTAEANDRDEPESMWFMLPNKHGHVTGIWRPRFRAHNKDVGAWHDGEVERISEVLGAFSIQD